MKSRNNFLHFCLYCGIQSNNEYKNPYAWGQKNLVTRMEGGGTGVDFGGSGKGDGAGDEVVLPLMMVLSSSHCRRNLLSKIKGNFGRPFFETTRALFLIDEIFTFPCPPLSLGRKEKKRF
ncbi:hypothetical protein NPIL_3541 [Nephila pilipes]|uniref:Uncharacterized protein n=1 Tax=Nephila pilipes TaxID=299642 RepID=A0A8X6Q0X8_NEPPI|nr:hypothetical protein NPIL_3541 [Nephila pilipes]